MTGARRAPVAASTEYPYVHVGHGVSAARKSWWLVVVLREPLAAALPDLGVPAPLDTIVARRGSRVILLMHDADSFQWVIAAGYPEPGPRADRGEATDAQWRAFNCDLDACLSRIHARAPIAVVLRSIDDEYGTALSPWHAWSCRELPRFLPFLAAALRAAKRAYVALACTMWRTWLAALPLDEQRAAIAAIDETPGARAVFACHGGAPEPVVPRAYNPAPTLAEQLPVWAALPVDAEVHSAFAAAFQHLRLESDARWTLVELAHALEDSPAHDAIYLAVLERALASPACEWPDTHWRPRLIQVLLRLGRIEDARVQLARVVVAATAYLDDSWGAILAVLDATDRAGDADVIFRVAQRYVAAFTETRKRVAKARRDQKARAATILAELAAPAFADLGALDDEALGHAAGLFEDLVVEGLAADGLLSDARRARAELAARRARRLADGTARLARGEDLDVASLRLLIDETEHTIATTRLEDLDRLVHAALRSPEVIPDLERLAYRARSANAPAAIATYRAVLASPIPPADLAAGTLRRSWLQSANAALIATCEQKLYPLSAQLADAVAPYVRENPYIAHSAACSYAAVKRYDDAFHMVKLAVELGYEHLDRLAVDPDLGPILTRADFKALFERSRP